MVVLQDQHCYLGSYFRHIFLNVKYKKYFRIQHLFFF